MSGNRRTRLDSGTGQETSSGDDSSTTEDEETTEQQAEPRTSTLQTPQRRTGPTSGGSGDSSDETEASDQSESDTASESSGERTTTPQRPATERTGPALDPGVSDGSLPENTQTGQQEREETRGRTRGIGSGGGTTDASRQARSVGDASDVDTSTSLFDRINERGRAFQQQRQQEGEQFGDVDWSFGLGGEEDEVEQAVDAAPERVRGAIEPTVTKLFSRDVAGESAGKAVLEAAGQDDAAEAYDRQVREFGTGIVADTPAAISSVPGFVLESAETGKRAVTDPAETASDVPDATAAAAVSTADSLRDRPGRTLGSLVGGTAAGVGLSRGLRSSRGRTTSQSQPTDAGTGYTPRTMQGGSDRGQMTMSDLVPGRKSRDQSDFSDGSGPEDLGDLMQQFERAERGRRANQRAEDRFIEEQLEAGRRQERGKEPTTVERSGGDYTAPRPDASTVSRGPDTTRSGPTSAQQSITRQRQSDTSLSPRESQLAARIQRETPSGDFRGVESTRRQTPSADLRDVDADVSGPSQSAAGTAGASTGALSDPVAEMGEREATAQRPSVEEGETELPGREDTSVAAGRGRLDAGGILGQEADLTSNLQGPRPIEDSRSGAATLSRTRAGEIIGQSPGTAVGVGQEIGTETDAQADQGQEPVQTQPPVTGQPPANDPPATDPSPGRPTPAPGSPTPPAGRPGGPVGRPGGPGRPRRIPMPDFDVEGEPAQPADGPSGGEFAGEWTRPVADPGDIFSGGGSSTGEPQVSGGEDGGPPPWERRDRDDDERDGGLGLFGSSPIGDGGPFG